ncbi:MAG: hypothetical protein KBB78_03995 [Candidatus Pacebacteria bacterium]|nr:hypothetical protein [Candidatus Paceibacterota bacterium]
MSRMEFGQRIDFYLPDFGVAIECKRFHTSRSEKQLSENPEIILIQGMNAAKAFKALLEK